MSASGHKKDGEWRDGKIVKTINDSKIHVPLQIVFQESQNILET